MKHSFVIIIVFLCISTIVYSQENVSVSDAYEQWHTNDQSQYRSFKREIPGILNIIPSPTAAISDIAYDGEYLWVAGFDEYLIYQIETKFGNIIKTIPTEVRKPYGLTFDGTHLWIIDNEKRLMLQLDTFDGSKVKCLQLPGDPLFSFPQGLAWDGTSIWHNDNAGNECQIKGDKTFKFSTDGSLLRTEKAVSRCPTGLAHDGTYLYSSDNSTYEIYKIDTRKFKVVNKFIAPGGRFPNGLAHDGASLWVGNSETDSIFQLDSTYKGYYYHIPTSIYPNPSVDIFNFRIPQNPENGNYSIQIYNSMGQFIHQEAIRQREFTIDFWQQSDGIYYYSIFDGEEIVDSGRFIKS